MLEGRRILVTGGAGYIGSHGVRVLCDLGADVVVLDSLYTGHREAVDPRARFVEGDVRDPDAVATAMEGAEAVLHFAAPAPVGESVRHPDRTSTSTREALVASLRPQPGRG